MDFQELNDDFGLPDMLRFRERNGLPFAEITTPAAAAALCLQGAHLTHWQPTGQSPVLFLSPRSEFSPGKAIRGGIPVIAPWFGPDTQDRAVGKPGPSHGFARTSPWTVAFAALVGDEVHLTLTLGPTDLSRSLGYPELRFAYQITVGSRLTLQLTLANGGPDPLTIEAALHTYLAVSDVRQTRLFGLGGVSFLDKMDGMKRKVQSDEPLLLGGPTDRVYFDTASTCTVEDPDGDRRITVEKANSRSTVVWNPWAELTAKLPDMEPDGWQRMLCVETANASPDTVTIAPEQTHTLRATLRAEPISTPA